VLEQTTKGRPATLIKNLPPTDEGFDLALAILDKNFNNKERQKQVL